MKITQLTIGILLFCNLSFAQEKENSQKKEWEKQEEKFKENEFRKQREKHEEEFKEEYRNYDILKRYEEQHLTSLPKTIRDSVIMAKIKMEYGLMSLPYIPNKYVEIKDTIVTEEVTNYFPEYLGKPIYWVIEKFKEGERKSIHTEYKRHFAISKEDGEVLWNMSEIITH